MISKLETSQSLNSEVAVIGSGPVGLYLSLLLAKRGFSVVIIEAGGLDVESNHLNHSKYIFKTPSALPENAHMFGGGGNLWFRRLGEFLERDFFAVPGVREEYWPIDYDQISQYASEVFQYFTGSPMRDLEISEQYIREVGLELPTMLSLRVYRTLPIKEMLRLKEEVLNSPNIRVLLNTYCESIGISVNHKGSESNFLKLVDALGESSELVANNIVVAAGALQSVALLEKSIPLIQPESREVVGKYLMEHLEGFVGYLDFKSEERRNSFLEKFVPRYLTESADGLVGAGVSFDSETLNRERLSTFHLEFYSERNDSIIEEWDYLFFRKIGLGGIFNILNRVSRFLAARLRTFKRSPFRVSVWVKAEEIPFRASKTGLDSKGERLVYGHRVSQESISLLNRNLRKISPILEDFSGAKFRLRLRIRLFSKFLRMRPNWHPMGSLRMGKDQTMSVCSENLEVWGAPGIYILNSAVFPTGSNANPTFMSWVLAHRLTNHLCKSLV